MALILLVGGLIGFDGDWAAPLSVRSKNVDVVTVDAAWKYLVPMLGVSVGGALLCLGGLIRLLSLWSRTS